MWNIIPVIVILLILPTSTEGCDTQRKIFVTLRNITLKENRDYLIENENLQTNGSIYIDKLYDINAIQAICKILHGDTNETLEELDAFFIKDCATMQKNSSFYCIPNGSNFDVFLNIKAKRIFSNHIMSLELKLTDRNCIKHSNSITVPTIYESSENNSTMSTTENNSTMTTTGSHQNKSGWLSWHYVLIVIVSVAFFAAAVVVSILLLRRYKQ
ncbi:uncharacterized protein LOC129922937 isoform X2 [Biomphalaria glabrata]|nr:uncharacterized protein LOC129922937 isoform X2 [Biomphalaria glabrata]XP_055867186.1 uncharacterized protein LOC129922937 isoform X2 [Biomphalaria glabrata]